MKIVSICQPHFFPWVGYFNMISNSNNFIFLDNIQYNRRSWQNRVYIMDSNKNKKKWLSMFLIKSSRKFKINEVFITKSSLTNFKNQLYENYKKTKYFEFYFELFTDMLEKNIENNLSELNINIIKEICKILKINISYQRSSDYAINEKKENLILALLKKNKADLYLANDGSINYADKDLFKKNKINMKPHMFLHPYYNQNINQKKNFVKGLSVIDILFNLGEDSTNVVKEFKVKF